MRLIDADAFIEYLGLDAENAREENLGEIVTLEDFDRQPTTYEVDKVVEQIECEYLMCRCKNNEICTYPETIGCCYDNGIKKAVEIIKSGGID